MDLQLLKAFQSIANTDWTAVVQAITAAGSLIVTIIGFIFVYLQVRQINNSLHSTAHGTLYAQATDLLKTLLAHSSLCPYFFEGKEITREDPEYNRVYVMAQTWAAHFEHVVMQMDYLPDHIRPAWVEYIRTVYSTSPMLQRHLLEAKECYSERLHEIIRRVRPLEQTSMQPDQVMHRLVPR